MTEPEPYVGPEVVAAFLDVPVNTLYAWHSRDKGPPVRKLGKHLRYRMSEVVEWADAQVDAPADVTTRRGRLRVVNEHPSAASPRARRRGS